MARAAGRGFTVAVIREIEMRYKTGIIAAIGCIGLLAPATPAFAQKKKAPAKPPASATVDPEIRAALGRMAGALRAMQSFELRADMTTEEVLDTGQKLQSSGVMTAQVRRPNRLYINLDSERRARQFYYDGKQLTIYGPVSGYYASVDAPPTIREMLRKVAERDGLETPLADLMQWGDSAVDTSRITSAMYAGSDRIGADACEHYAFREPGTDWQLWIRKAEPALPCKVVIVNTDDPVQPQTSAVFNWTARQIADQQFSFTPPADAHRITMGQAQVAAKGGKK
jgi:hypothetical protein